MTIWLTGLSGAGKTTIATELSRVLCANGKLVEILDGDVVRHALCQDLGFSREDRNQNIFRLAYVAQLLARHGITVIVAAISPYEEARNRAKHELHPCIEVFVNTPIAICEQQDVKGLYAKARLGILQNMTGVNDPYESPLAPDVTCSPHLDGLDLCISRILDVFEGRQRA